MLILTGLPGSGKTFVSNYFAQKGIPLVRMGDVTREELTKRKIADTPENEDSMRRELREKYGSFVFAQRVVIKVFEYLKSSELTFIEGMRSFDEAIFFKRELPNVHIIFLKADTHIRYARLKNRKNRRFSEKQAKDRDTYEGVTLGLNTIEKESDFVITNNESNKELQKKLNSIFNTIQQWTQQ